MDGAHEVTEALTAAVARMLRPVIRVLLRHGLSFKEFSELAKSVYVRVASEEFMIEGKRQTISRVSVLTGLTRKDVHRLLHQPPVASRETSRRYNRAARVTTGWLQDPDFTDPHGNPRALALEDGSSSFAALVRRYSGDMPMRAVLDELLRVGAVQRLDDGRVRLAARGYVPSTSETDKLGILGADVADLICTIDHNLQVGVTDPFFQRKVMYDNLPVEVIPQLRQLSADHGQTLLENLNRWLSKHDRDENPSVGGTGRMRAGVGVFYFEEDVAGKSEEK